MPGPKKNKINLKDVGLDEVILNYDGTPITEPLPKGEICKECEGPTIKAEPLTRRKALLNILSMPGGDEVDAVKSFGLMNKLWSPETVTLDDLNNKNKAVKEKAYLLAIAEKTKFYYPFVKGYLIGFLS